MRYSQQRRKRSPQRAISKQRIIPGLLIAVLTLYYAKDAFYFDNGRGGADWQIGQPHVSIMNAHQGRSLAEVRQFALKLVNRDRQLNGLVPLVEDPLLSQTAQGHSQDMMTRNYYAHDTPEGKTPSDRFAQLGGRGGVGENIMEQTGATGISLNYGLIERFQKGWMYSTGHRQNLLTPHYTRFGYGIVTDALTGRAYAVQNFAAPTTN